MMITADDLVPGMSVTIHSMNVHSHPVRREQMQRSAPRLGCIPLIPPGIPLHVSAVSLPFVLCRGCDFQGNTGPVIIDVRLTRLTTISDAYVEAFASLAIEGSAAQEQAEDNSDA